MVGFASALFVDGRLLDSLAFIVESMTSKRVQLVLTHKPYQVILLANGGKVG